MILEVGQELTKRAMYSPTFNESAVFQGGEMSWLALKIYRESIELDQFSALAIEGLALEMIAALCRSDTARSAKHPPSWLLEARDIIHDHFAEAVSVCSIANMVGVHSVHLARTFRKHYRASIGEYVRRLRIESARREICSTNLSLADIAVKSGFCDQGHLSRVFKRFSGMSPAKYRALFQ
ncbi:MAG: helix-turn-helix domain-containing protein [Pyrinomonadaceae bacterium]